MKNYIFLIKKTFKRNHKLYSIRSESILIYLFSLVSYVITPFFLIFNIRPNTITFLNFLIAITSIALIFLGQAKFFILGITLYFVFRVFDFCDGNVARLTNQASFYGRFLDSILDIFYESFLILSIGFYCFKYYNSEELFFLAIVSSIFSIYSTCIHDKYSSLVRWLNEENKTKFTPYLRKKYFARLGFIMNDLNNLFLILLLFFNQNLKMFLILSTLFFSSFIFTSIINLSKHFYSARMVLRYQAQDKRTYEKRKVK